MIRRTGVMIVGTLSIALAVPGCGDGSNAAKRTAPERPFQGTTIVVVAVDDSAILNVVEAQRGEWETARGGIVELRKKTVDPQSLGDADVVFFQGDRLGDLIDENALETLPETFADSPSSPEEARGRVDFQAIVPAFREEVSHYGKSRVALPIGGSALVLVYRKDAFQREANVSEAKKADLALEPPETWERLDGLARFFHGRDWSGDGAVDSGIALALGPDRDEGVADAIALARAASSGMHPDDFSFLFDAETLAPRVASPPFLETFRALKALATLGPPGMSEFDAEAARQRFRAGETALLIDRAERWTGWVDPKSSKGRDISIGVAPLPGSKRVFDRDRSRWDDSRGINRPTWLLRGGGLLVGVSIKSPQAKRAAVLDFLTYLISPETAERMRADRGFDLIPVRDALIGQGLADPRLAPGVDGRLWAAAVGQTFHVARVSPGLRIRDARGYLADFGLSRAKSLAGSDPLSALEDLSRAWKERSKVLDLPRQTWHYRRSLIELSAPDQPPPRSLK